MEPSYYHAVKKLVDSAGRKLRPPVVYFINPKGQHGTFPDGALIPENHVPKGGQQSLPFDLSAKRKPERGVVEVKAVDTSLDTLAQSEQVGRYLKAYGQVLATNLREFALLQLHDGVAVEVERYSLATSAAQFWNLAEDPEKAARQHDTPLEEFLRRVLLATTSLTSPADVAAHLASYAREARFILDRNGSMNELTALRETLEGALGVQFSAEKGDDFFRSTLVQTLFYGVFSAWVLWHEGEPKSQQRFRWQESHLWLHLPVIEGLFRGTTSRRVLDQTGLAHTLSNAERLLNRVDRRSFFEAFERGLVVQYFYEPFLAAFDPELRKQLGVWYTPPELVRYMVARVDRILKTELNEPDGLASSNVLVLDPCCGTGAYLVECLRVVLRHYEELGEGLVHGDDLRNAVMERFYGFELLPGPFIVAHLQVGFLLAKHGIRLGANERAGIFLTNALTGWEPASDEKAKLDIIGLYAESNHARKVKQEKPILAIMGNPPYNGYAGTFQMAEEREIVTRYVAGRRKGQGLNDLYVRFYAMADRRIEMTGRGVISFVSNYSWLDGLSFSAMRSRFLRTFDGIWIDNLNGDKYATGKTTPSGLPDPSVFSTEFNREGIQVGTAIATLLRKGNDAEPEDSEVKVYYRDFWGAGKRADLDRSHETDTPDYVRLRPAVPLGWPFKPRSVGAFYFSWPSLPQLLPTSFPGIKTSRDELLVSIDKGRLEGRMQAYLDSKVADETMRSMCPCALQTTARFAAPAVRAHLQRRGFEGAKIQRYAYRPLDNRWLYYESETKLLDEKRSEYVDNLLPDTVSLGASADQRRGYSPSPVASSLASLHLNERGVSMFPLRVTKGSSLGPAQPLLSGLDFRNLESMEGSWNLSQLAWDILDTCQIEDDPSVVFFHALAVLHSPQYVDENVGALRQDWPRIPLVAAKNLTPEASLVWRSILRNGAALGRQIAALLDADKSVSGVTEGKLWDTMAAIGKFEWLSVGTPNEQDESLAMRGNWGYRSQSGAIMPAAGRLQREVPPSIFSADLLQSDVEAALSNARIRSVAPGTVTVFMSDRACWTGIPIAAWEYTLGGYQVLKKWLSYRERDVLGRPMRLAEVREFSALARRLAAVIALHPRLDEHYRYACEAALALNRLEVEPTYERDLLTASLF